MRSLPFFFLSFLLFFLCAAQEARAQPFGHERNASQARSAMPAPPRGGFPDIEEKPDRSPLEEMYSGRIVDELEQYGYDLFNRHVERYGARKTIENEDGEEARYNDNLPSGAVQDNFVLGFGDRLNITFRGQRNDQKTYKIDNDGRVIIDGLPPIPAAGRTIAQVRAALNAHAKTLHNTEIYVSLDAVRQIGVLVVGHVNKPGRHNLTVFHTVMDALAAAGGIDKTGSLRQIKLVRDGRSAVLDLYGLLMHGSANMDVSLRDGDRIIVPPIGPTMAIAGQVKRPGIYELQTELQGMWHKPESRSAQISLNEALEFAAGTLSPGDNRYVHLYMSADGHERVRDVSKPFAPVFGDGGILMVSRGQGRRAGTVELAGHTIGEGIYALENTPTLSSLIPDARVLERDTYPLIGVIERENAEHMTSEFLAFPPSLVLKKQFDRKLQDGDVVHLFSNEDIRALADTPQEEQDALYQPAAMGSAFGEEIDEPLDPVIAAFLRERAVFVRGAVRQPGAYPATEGASLESVIAVAGGLSLEANTANVEVTSKRLGEGHQQAGRSGTRRLHINFRETNPARVMLGPGDTVRINQRFHKIKDKNVLVVGEVSHPGRYDIMPGDKLSDLLERAGGLTPQAYPEGAIFSRKSERKAEELRFRSAAAELEKSIATALQSDDKDKQPGAQQVSFARELADELRTVEAVGRITVEADPAILKARPELDLLLEEGDRLFIPKRPLTVRVRGEVLSPAALQFREGNDARDYIMQAGGFSYFADKSRAFVVYPDGSAQPLEVDHWNHRPLKIPPGSTVVVPRDPKPFDFLASAEKVSQIIANLALTGIWIDDLQED